MSLKLKTFMTVLVVLAFTSAIGCGNGQNNSSNGLTKADLHDEAQAAAHEMVMAVDTLIGLSERYQIDITLEPADHSNGISNEHRMRDMTLANLSGLLEEVKTLEGRYSRSISTLQRLRLAEDLTEEEFSRITEIAVELSGHLATITRNKVAAETELRRRSI